MTQLRDTNVQKCLSIVKDFHDAIAVDESDLELKEKKKQSEEAVVHLLRVFGERKEAPLLVCLGCVQEATGKAVNN